MKGKRRRQFSMILALLVCDASQPDKIKKKGSCRYSCTTASFPLSIHPIGMDEKK
jgi:hypothetical protein